LIKEGQRLGPIRATLRRRGRFGGVPVVNSMVAKTLTQTFDFHLLQSVLFSRYRDEIDFADMAGALIRLLVSDRAPVFEFEFRPRSGKISLGLSVDFVHRTFDAFATRAAALMSEELTYVAMIAVLIVDHGADIGCLLGGRLHLPFDCCIERTAARMCQIEIEVAAWSQLGQGKVVQMEVAFVGVLDDGDEALSVLDQQPLQRATYPQTVRIVVGRKLAHICDRYRIGDDPCGKHHAVAPEAVPLSILRHIRKSNSHLSDLRRPDAVEDPGCLGISHVRRIARYSTGFGRYAFDRFMGFAPSPRRPAITAMVYELYCRHFPPPIGSSFRRPAARRNGQPTESETI
jgi:hypothetical protein